MRSFCVTAPCSVSLRRMPKGKSMSLPIELPPELERELSAEATRLGLPLSEYALRVLAAGRTRVAAPRNGAELVDYWQQAGLVGTRPDISDASAHARAVRKATEHRERR